MRILIGTPVIGDAFGQERVVRFLSESLQANGHEVYFLGETTGGDIPPNQGALCVEDLTSFHLLSPREKARTANHAAMDFVDEIQPDVVHFMDQYNPEITRSILTKYPGVLSCHTVAPTCPSSTRLVDGGKVCEKTSGWACVLHHQSQHCLSFLKNDLRRVHAVHQYLRKRRAVEGVEAYIAISKYVAETLIRDGYPAAKIHTIYNPVKALAPVRGKATENIFVVASRLVPLKGIDRLLEALKWVEAYPWELQICGDGPEEGRLRDLTEALGMAKRVQFLGKLPYTETVRRMGRALAVLQPNVGPEAFGMTVAESLALGVCVIGFDIPALNEIVVHEKQGLLAKRGDVASLSDCLRRVLEKPELAQRLGSQGPDWVKERFSEAAHYEKTLQVYETAIQARKGRVGQPHTKPEFLKGESESSAQNPPSKQRPKTVQARK